jgi:hypothetical protein
MSLKIKGVTGIAAHKRTILKGEAREKIALLLGLEAAYCSVRFLLYGYARERRSRRRSESVWQQPTKLSSGAFEAQDELKLPPPRE